MLCMNYYSRIKCWSKEVFYSLARDITLFIRVNWFETLPRIWLFNSANQSMSILTIGIYYTRMIHTIDMCEV